MRYYLGSQNSCPLTAVCIMLSITVSIIYYQNYISFGPITWTKKAAEEAEAVASVYCSEHGRAFIDGNITKGGVPECECNNCYSGLDCSWLDTKNCTADARTGDALFLEKYWLQRKSRSAVVISGWHRMSYYIDQHSQKFHSGVLDFHIRELHRKVGNANVANASIVFGNGVTQLLTGLVIVLSQHRSTLSADKAAKVVANVPYYPVFRKQTTFFRYKGYNWTGNASDYVDTESPEDFIEIVTSPNNPDGNPRRQQITGALAITDRVYDWPHYTAIRSVPANDDIMLFSLSKLTGHAGSRFGWAVIKDRKVYENLMRYMVESSEGTSRDTQLRTLGIIKEITKQFKPSLKSSDDIFQFGHEILRKRWSTLYNLVSHSPSKRFILQNLTKAPCSYFKRKREPSPAFGWLKCKWEEDDNCEAVLAKGGILTQGGKLFDASDRYARLSLIKTDDDFDQLIQKLTLLVNAPKTK